MIQGERPGAEAANDDVERFRRESEERHRLQQRAENRASWIDQRSRLSEAFALMTEDHAARAAALRIHAGGEGTSYGGL